MRHLATPIRVQQVRSIRVPFRVFSSSRLRLLEALECLGCAEGSSRERVRDAFYTLAKKHHPDVNPAGAETFKRLAEAFETAMASEPDASEDGDVEMTGEAADPLAVFLRVEKERAREMRRELSEAAQLNSGGLDKGGLWMLAAQMAETLPAGPAESPKRVPAGRRRRRKGGPR